MAVAGHYNVTLFLREWDNMSGEMRIGVLRDFIAKNESRTGPQIDAQFGQISSLFLARICVYIKLNFASSTNLSEPLKALHLFVASTGGCTFVEEVVENGMVMTLQEICVSSKSPEINQYWALECLYRICLAGNQYRLMVCESYGIRYVAECFTRASEEQTQQAARKLLETLAEGNDERYDEQVYRSFIGCLPCQSSNTQHLALQALHEMQLKRDTVHPTLIELLYRLLTSANLKVQCATIELFRVIAKLESYDKFLPGLIALLRPARAVNLERFLNPNLDDADADSSNEAGGEHNDTSSISQLVTIGAGESKRGRKKRGLAMANGPGAGMSQARSLVDPGPAITRDPEGGIYGISIDKLLERQAMKKFDEAQRELLLKTVSEVNNTIASGAASGAANDGASVVEQVSLVDGTSAGVVSCFIQQASATRCILELCQNNAHLAQQALKLDVIGSLLHALGNMEHQTSQRLSAVTLKFFCEQYADLLVQPIKKTIGEEMFRRIMEETEVFYFLMSPLEADIFLSNRFDINASD